MAEPRELRALHFKGAIVSPCDESPTLSPSPHSSSMSSLDCSIEEQDLDDTFEALQQHDRTFGSRDTAGSSLDGKGWPLLRSLVFSPATGLRSESSSIDLEPAICPGVFVGPAEVSGSGLVIGSKDRGFSGNCEPAVVPFHQVYWTGKEQAYMMQAMTSGKISGLGPFTGKCESHLEQVLGVPRALLTTSCTHALELMALLLNVGPGDEVIIPSFTFCSTASAFSRHGACIVFVDSRTDTFNIDERLIEQAITPRTKAIVVMHYAGVACDMDEIWRVASKYGVHVLEDAAHAFLGSYKGRPLGSLGTFGALSFHETKNITCGEGGALLINDARFVERALTIRSCGNDRHRFVQGSALSYTWRDVGSSYAPSDLLAATLLAQLELSVPITAKRGLLWHRYRDSLRDWADANSVVLPRVPTVCQPAYHIFAVLMPSPQAATGESSVSVV
ncbi:hypothetical protein KFL_000250490 [Klebsormidium nitens]|uniref:dTDP-4-amino-4,6-dideoxygalactose transaminase n=1 Tax=Klebsormidium nitens TaxID=105231 RepID=A0A1Y1HQA9_KLENI|nr:hypothetical protein KFL_000250490 [Klebsormidium nitens]|eukprot:GAQ79171.1 hypothetical protein KFL_000250490 [Klebsormidium nitens]